jgi:uncharacterized protein (DUF2126 family)
MKPQRSHRSALLSSHPWMAAAAAGAGKRLEDAGIRLTLGGEPTFVPVDPSGTEWIFNAIGPTKLRYARAVVDRLLEGPMRGGAAFFCPGKLYPGEVNPRWMFRVLAPRAGGSLVGLRGGRRPARDPGDFGVALCRGLGVRPHWVRFTDPLHAGNVVLAMPLDHNGSGWTSAPWPLSPARRRLLEAGGPAGLRLPLGDFPRGVARRVLTIEWRGRTPGVFFPPLLQGPFLELLEAVEACLPAHAARISHQGYVPEDEAGIWISLGVTPDPGVLEINLPVCGSWDEYVYWLGEACAAAGAVGMRPAKKPRRGFEEGTGGGNHILFGGPSPENNPFFTRPRWLASILRFWQRHPALSYAFTGCYAGPYSQAPRPDESVRDRHDLEMAYRFLESLPPGDHREIINETLRHLHTDLAGNTHRSEISFDKFWNPAWPGGALGLVEFRAFETISKPVWMAAVALLLTCVAAHALRAGRPRALKDFGSSLHDQYFLPSILWQDLRHILQELAGNGLVLDESLYRAIWEWRFPVVLEHGGGGGKLLVRRALESWPLLCETPIEGGNTSRYVDTSMHRLEFAADAAFADRHAIYVAGRLLPLKRHALAGWLAGLRFRRSNLRPSLHPGLPPHLPLEICILDKRTHRATAEFSLGACDAAFRAAKHEGRRKLGGPPCRTRRRGDFTCDLRL